ncbi:Exportin-T like protein [Verticillium longisporum]|nr:Exportin-T like protein [Verticillium longisporum]
MEAQIENAVEIAWSPTSDQALKGQAFEFLNQLRTDPQGWQASANLFARTPRTSEVVRMVCLEIVNNAVHTQGLDSASLSFLKQTLLEYVRQVYGQDRQDQVDPPSLQNKLAQTLTYLFVFLYADGWESFIDDFLALTYSPNSSRQDNISGTVLYLRILGSVHDEIADMLLSRNSNDAKRNTDLKDQLRDRHVQKIAQSWKDLLVRHAAGWTLVLS